MRRSLSRPTALILLVTLLLLLAISCDTSEETAAPTVPPDPTATVPPTLTAVAAPESSETRTLVDMKGREVEIPTHPQRIVSVFPYVTFTTLALGGQEALVGIDSMSAKNAKLAEIYPIVQELPDVGSFFSLNEESVLLAAPDLVLTVSWHRDPDQTQDKLGVPLVCLDMNYYKESLTFLAQLLGEAAGARAQALIDYHDAKMAEITAVVPTDDKVKIYVAGGDGFLSTFGKESTWHFEIEDAGGVNVGADLIGGGSHQVSMEQVMLWDPDVIVLDPSCPDDVQTIMSDERWQSITAVQAGRVYRAPSGFLDVWGRPHIESALCRVWLANKLYPEALDWDMVAEAQEFYATAYNVTLSQAEIDAILNPE